MDAELLSVKVGPFPVRVRIAHLPDLPPPGHVLVCSSVPAGDVVLDT